MTKKGSHLIALDTKAEIKAGNTNFKIIRGLYASPRILQNFKVQRDRTMQFKRKEEGRELRINDVSIIILKQNVSSVIINSPLFVYLEFSAHK